MVTHVAIELRAGELLMLHAASCVLRHSGETVVVVGASGQGKTTLIRQLARHGTYLTDETVGIDAGGHIVPHPKPLSVLTPGLQHKVQIDPKDLAMQVDLTPLVSVDRLFFLNRTAGLHEPGVSRVSDASAIVRLAEQSSQLQSLQTPLQRLHRFVQDSGGAWELSYSEASSVPHFLGAGRARAL